MKPHLIALIATAAACGGGSSRQQVTFTHLAFDVPSDWSEARSMRRGLATSMWTPDENSAKESVTVIRTDRAAGVASAGSPAIDRLVVSAEAGLPSARASSVIPILTKNGLPGVRVDVDFVPPGLREHYHRVHVVLIDAAKSSLIHVLYTAKTPDENESALNLVLSTIREEG